MRLPLLYLVMRRVRRGYYEVELRQLWDGREPPRRARSPSATRAPARRTCCASPADWLWTYRRWRFKKPLYGAA